MKRLLLSILACLLSCAPVLAYDTINIFDGACRDGEPVQLAWMGSLGVAASGKVACTTSNDSKLFTPATQPGTSTGGNTTYNGIKIALESTTTITAYKMRQCDAGLDAGSVKTSLYNDDGNGATSKPTTEVSGSSKTIESSAITNCNANSVIDYDLDTPLEVSAGTYWIISVELSGADRNSIYASSTGDRVCYGSDGATWTCATTASYDMELWGCQ